VVINSGWCHGRFRRFKRIVPSGSCDCAAVASLACSLSLSLSLSRARHARHRRAVAVDLHAAVWDNSELHVAGCRLGTNRRGKPSQGATVARVP